MEVSPGTRGSAGHDVLHKCCKEGQSKWQGLSTGRPQWGPRVPAPHRPTPQPAEPTFIIDAAIGVFLPRHQFVHLIFSEPLSWPGGGRLSQHRGTGAKSGGTHRAPLDSGSASLALPHLTLAQPSQLTRPWSSPPFLRPGESVRSQRGDLGCRLGVPSEPGLCPQQCQLGVQVPRTHCPFSYRGPLGGSLPSRGGQDPHVTGSSPSGQPFEARGRAHGRELRALGNNGGGDKETASLFSRQVCHFPASEHCVLPSSPP